MCSALLGLLISLPLIWRFQRGRRPGYQFTRNRRLDSLDRRALLAGHRRHQLPAGDAHHAAGRDLDSFFLERHQDADEGVLHSLPAAAGGHAGRFHVAGFFPLLPVLGSDAGADVFPDRRLGQRPPAVRRDQVFPVHAGWFGADAAGDPGALLSSAAGRRAYTFDIPTLLAAVPQFSTRIPASAAVLGVLLRLRHQGADVPVPHLAAGRAHRSAHGGLGDSGGRAVEDGHVRLHPLLAAAAAARIPPRATRSSRF